MHHTTTMRTGFNPQRGLMITAKRTALRIDAAVRKQCLRVLWKVAITAIPAVKGTVVIPGELHSRGGDVNAMCRVGS